MAPFRAFPKRADDGPQTEVSLAELLASDLFRNGAFAPPPDVIQNLTNPDDIGSVLIIVTAIGLVVIFICVFLRGWTKFMILGSPVRMAWSDLTFTLAILTIIAVFVAGFVATTGYGGGTGDSPMGCISIEILHTTKSRFLECDLYLQPLSPGVDQSHNFLDLYRTVREFEADPDIVHSWRLDDWGILFGNLHRVVCFIFPAWERNICITHFDRCPFSYRKHKLSCSCCRACN